MNTVCVCACVRFNTIRSTQHSHTHTLTHTHTVSRLANLLEKLERQRDGIVVAEPELARGRVLLLDEPHHPAIRQVLFIRGAVHEQVVVILASRRRGRAPAACSRLSHALHDHVVERGHGGSGGNGESVIWALRKRAKRRGEARRDARAAATRGPNETSNEVGLRYPEYCSCASKA